MDKSSFFGSSCIHRTSHCDMARSEAYRTNLSGNLGRFLSGGKSNHRRDPFVVTKPTRLVILGVICIYKQQLFCQPWKSFRKSIFWNHFQLNWMSFNVEVFSRLSTIVFRCWVARSPIGWSINSRGIRCRGAPWSDRISLDQNTEGGMIRVKINNTPEKLTFWT